MRPLPLLLAVPGAAEVQVGPDLVDPLSDVGISGVLGGEHRRRVDDDAEVARHVLGPGPGRRLQQPSQPALAERLDLGWRQPHDVAYDRAADDRAGVGQLGQRVPLPGVGTADPGGREAGQLGGGRLADGHGAGTVGRGPPQLGGERRQGQPARLGPGDLLDLDVVPRELGEEPGRPILAVLAPGGGDHQGAPRPGDGDIEQPALLVEELGGQRGRRRVGALAARSPTAASGVDRVNQFVHAEQGGPHSQVGPGAFLYACHHHQVPFEPLGAMSGEDADGITLGGTFGQGVSGDLLATEAVEEQPRQPRRQPGGEAGGRVEQRDNCVQITIGGGATGPAGRTRRLPGRAKAGRVPDGPEHLVRGRAGPGALPRRGQQARNPPRRIRRPGRQSR